MIFKTALKYKIYEWCLETFVNKLVNTFFNDIGKNKRELDESEIRVGMKIDEIICVRSDWVVFRYRMCEIIQIGSTGVYFRSEMEKIGEEDWIIRHDGNSSSWGLPGMGDYRGGNNGVTFYQYL